VNIESDAVVWPNDCLRYFCLVFCMKYSGRRSTAAMARTPRKKLLKVWNAAGRAQRDLDLAKEKLFPDLLKPGTG